MQRLAQHSIKTDSIRLLTHSMTDSSKCVDKRFLLCQARAISVQMDFPPQLPHTMHLASLPPVASSQVNF